MRAGVGVVDRRATPSPSGRGDIGVRRDRILAHGREVALLERALVGHPVRPRLLERHAEDLAELRWRSSARLSSPPRDPLDQLLGRVRAAPARS